MDTQHQKDMDGFIRWCLGQYDTHYDMDDVQNVWLYLLENTGSFKNNPKSILRDYIKHYVVRKYDRQDPIDYGDMDTFEDVKEESQLDLDLLSVDERKVIQLRVYENMAWNQIATHMSTSMTSCQRIFSRGLGVLSSSCIE